MLKMSVNLVMVKLV